MPDKKEIVDLLEFVNEERNKGISVDADLIYKEFDKGIVKKAVQWNLIEFSGTDYYLTEKGYNTLNEGKISKNTQELTEVMRKFNESSDKSNASMIKLGKWNLRFFIISILISLLALFLTYNIGYGGAKLKWEYSVSGFNNNFFYYNDTILLEFVVKNDGFSSTLYSIEPIIDCSVSNCSVEISFDGEEPFEKISKPKMKSIEAKSGQFVMIIIRNVPPEQVGNTFEVLVRDLRTNKHNYIQFNRADDDLTKFFIEALYSSQKTS